MEKFSAGDFPETAGLGLVIRCRIWWAPAKVLLGRLVRRPTKMASDSERQQQGGGFGVYFLHATYSCMGDYN